MKPRYDKLALIIVLGGTLLQKEFTQEQRATMGSLNSLFGSLFFGLCAIAIGVVADAFSPTTALLLGEVVLLSLLPLYWRLFKH